MNCCVYLILLLCTLECQELIVEALFVCFSWAEVEYFSNAAYWKPDLMKLFIDLQCSVVGSEKITQICF